jgi:acyl-CoA reductase-like NAD-dependent aldehyde dehydrogenase
MNGQIIIDGEIIARNPADGSELARVKSDTPDTVREAVARARKASAAWGALSYRERGAYLSRVRDRFLERADQIAEILHKENGKPQTEAYFAEVIPNLDLFDYHIANDHKLLADEVVKLSPLNYPGKRGVIQHVPLGVIGLIAPWNYPVSIPLRTLIPALMTGNAVVFKPSEYAALSGQAIFDLFEGILPKDVLVLVQGAGPIGASVIEAGIDRVIFTGSVGTGKKVGVAAAERLIPASLELGGKDAAIVFEDADLDRAANGIVWSAFGNAGQNCAAVERVYVVEKVAEPFLQRVVAKTKSLRLTCDGPEAEVGPLINERQLEIVEQQVNDAISKGAKVLAGGSRRTPGYFYEPTVLADVDHRMAVMREETFGPLLPVQVVPSVDDAVRLANDSNYGLTASLWTRDTARAKALASRLQTGIVTINNHSFTAAIPQAPWTGVKETGSGVTNSTAALHEMTRPRFTLVDSSKEKLEVWWFPYTPTLRGLAAGVLQMAKRGLGPKLSAVPKLLPLQRKRLKES